MIKVNFYVDEYVLYSTKSAAGRIVSTSFDTKVAAERYAAVRHAVVRPPLKAQGTTLGQKLFQALAR